MAATDQLTVDHPTPANDTYCDWLIRRSHTRILAEETSTSENRRFPISDLVP